jgi:hypothetical protein
VGAAVPVEDGSAADCAQLVPIGAVVVKTISSRVENSLIGFMAITKNGG